MRPLFSFVLDQFVEIFSAEIMRSEECEVFNAPNTSAPMLIANREPVSIRVAMKSLDYQAQFIYHLSREMTHYVICQYQMV